MMPCFVPPERPANTVSPLVDIPFPAGGLFHPDDDHQEIAFRYAVEKINSDRTILPRSKLLAQIERISPQDSFLASKRVCHLLGVGVAAIFGPQSSHTASHVQSICDTMEGW
uniref:Receptor ligand binding region domain-containing protein n=1 Tax=Anopheles epiroticus TaxID=199890 RepID=A0A182P836_9DIPT